MNRLFAFLLVITLVLGMAACNKDAKTSPTPAPSPPGESPQEEKPATSAVEPDADGPKDNDFLAQAHAMGYTDTQLDTLYNCEVPEEVILSLTNSDPEYDFFIGETTDGRYRLDGYYVTPFMGCMYVMDQETGQATILPDWQNGYSKFDLIDDVSFYVSYVQLGSADREAGIRVYQFGQPDEPVAAWNLTDSNFTGPTMKGLLETYHQPLDQLFVAFWVEVPEEIGALVDTYQVTVLGYDCEVISTFDTGVTIQLGKTGIAAPNVDRCNAHMDPVADSIYFELDETVYILNYNTATVTAV